jgi:hypothetical protein
VGQTTLKIASIKMVKNEKICSYNQHFLYTICVRHFFASKDVRENTGFGFDSQEKQRLVSTRAFNYAQARLVVHLWWIENWCESKKQLNNLLRKKNNN